MIEDLTHAYVDWDGGRAEVGPLVVDLRWLASVVCDFVYFMPPAGSSKLATACRDDAIAREALSHLADAAAAVGLTVAREADGGAGRSFDSYRLGGRGPLWVLVHRAAPIFAFARTSPTGFPLDPTMSVVDPPFDVGRLLSTNWRLLTADQASQPVTEGRTVDLSPEGLITSGREPENVWQLLFMSKG